MSILLSEKTPEMTSYDIASIERKWLNPVVPIRAHQVQEGELFAVPEVAPIPMIDPDPGFITEGGTNDQQTYAVPKVSRSKIATV